jgi:poly(hydroxyalkanoate) depolymerase family esterase
LQCSNYLVLDELEEVSPTKELPVSLAKNIEFLRRLPKLNGINGFGHFGRSLDPDHHSPLTETTAFGSNPGDLRMFSFAPVNLQPGAGLVVVLHGCGQTAAGYDLGAGWSTLAKRFGFALLMPQQQPSNNAQACFNWFNPEDTTRDSGEACSIRQMIAQMVRDYKINQRRIFVTGLSAGGAMTSVMLATYPEVFAGGAVIAGLPYGVATHQITKVLGRNSRCGMAAPIAQSTPLTPTRSSSSGSTCINCLRRRCRRAPSTVIRTKSGGMRMARQ